jgi:hypothetical protein
MITLGTGALVGRNGVSDARVVPLHAYAVVDVANDEDEGGGARRLKVMNPWKRGRTRMDDARAWTRDLLESLVEEAEDEEADEPSGKRLPRAVLHPRIRQAHTQRFHCRYMVDDLGRGLQYFRHCEFELGLAHFRKLGDGPRVSPARPCPESRTDLPSR